MIPDSQRGSAYDAFLSYARADDDDDRITTLRLRLAAEVRMLTGFPFRIFQDREGVGLGQQWRSLIEDSIDGILLLITVITPSFLLSKNCRAEVSRFLDRERSLERSDLIIPILYVATPQLEDKDDPIARKLSERQYTEWGGLRFRDYESNPVRKGIHEIATHIVKALGRISPPQQVHNPEPATVDAEPGSLELLAEMETAMDYFNADIQDLTAHTNQFTSLMVESTEEMQAVEKGPRPSSARLLTIRRLSKGLEEPVSALERATDYYLDHMGQINAGIKVLIDMTPESATTEEGVASAQRFLATLTELVDIVDDSFASIRGFRQALVANYHLSSTLRPVLKRTARTLDRILSTQDGFRDWRDGVAAALGNV